MRALYHRSIAVIGLLLVIAASAFTAQASCATGPSRRGAGAGTVSGYQVSGLQFSLGDDPTYLEAVTFDLDAPAREAWVGFGPEEGESFQCRNTAGNRWVCRLAGVQIGEVGLIRVTASG